MELLKNLSSPISERLKSPLYSALIFSWLICNWKIWIALIFYEESVNGVDKIQYITCLTHNYCRMYILPIILTAFYLKIMPLIDYYVFKNNERNKARKQQARLDQLKISTVSGADYLELLTEKESLKNQYGVAASNIETNQNKINSLEQTILNLQNMSNKQNDELNTYYNFKNHRKNLRGQIMTNDWKRTFYSDPSKPTETEIFYIDSSNNYVLRTSKTNEKIMFTLDGIDIDFENKTITFFKIGYGDNAKSIYKVYLRNTSDSSKPHYKGNEINIFNPDDKIEVSYEPKI